MRCTGCPVPPGASNGPTNHQYGTSHLPGNSTSSSQTLPLANTLQTCIPSGSPAVETPSAGRSPPQIQPYSLTAAPLHQSEIYWSDSSGVLVRSHWPIRHWFAKAVTPWQVTFITASHTSASPRTSIAFAMTKTQPSFHCRSPWTDSFDDIAPRHLNTIDCAVIVALHNTLARCASQENHGYGSSRGQICRPSARPLSLAALSQRQS